MADSDQKPADRVMQLMALMKIRNAAMAEDLEVYRQAGIATERLEQSRRIVWAQEMVALETEIHRLCE